MSVTVEFYQFAKKKNSTAVPDSSGTEFECALKTPCSWYEPVFLLHDTGTPVWNYASWGTWYYFVTDIIAQAQDLFEVRCSLDPLATFRAQIFATPAFIMYDTAANTEISDQRLSTKTTASISAANASINMLEVGETILMGIVGDDSTGVYAVSALQAAELLKSSRMSNWLDSVGLEVGQVTDLAGLADVLASGMRQLIASGKATDCIKSALLLPVSASNFAGTSKTIHLGEYDTGITGKLLTPTARAFASVTVNIPWQASDWRRNAPYHSIYLSLPYVGMVPLSPSELMGISSLTISVYISQNGGIIYEVFPSGQTGLIGRYSGNCASNYMVGASNFTPMQAITSIGGAVAAAATSLVNPAAGAGILLGTMNGSQQLPACVGSSGGGALTSGYIITCWTVFHDTAVSPDSVAPVMGTPKMAAQLIGSVPGFVQTRAASVAAEAPEYILNAINSALDGGVYIE
ncbi:MAG: hypothetical protein IKD62_02835 [Oscillospiraceae bacterium]|nr:hypothetical protein [Oscillospiraceae bacterium]